MYMFVNGFTCFIIVGNGSLGFLRKIVFWKPLVTNTTVNLQILISFIIRACVRVCLFSVTPILEDPCPSFNKRQVLTVPHNPIKSDFTLNFR